MTYLSLQNSDFFTTLHLESSLRGERWSEVFEAEVNSYHFSNRPNRIIGTFQYLKIWGKSSHPIRANGYPFFFPTRARRINILRRVTEESGHFFFSPTSAVGRVNHIQTVFARTWRSRRTRKYRCAESAIRRKKKEKFRQWRAKGVTRHLAISITRRERAKKSSRTRIMYGGHRGWVRSTVSWNLRWHDQCGFLQIYYIRWCILYFTKFLEARSIVWISGDNRIFSLNSDVDRSIKDWSVCGIRKKGKLRFDSYLYISCRVAWEMYFNLFSSL